MTQWCSGNASALCARGPRFNSGLLQEFLGLIFCLLLSCFYFLSINTLFVTVFCKSFCNVNLFSILNILIKDYIVCTSKFRLDFTSLLLYVVDVPVTITNASPVASRRDSECTFHKCFNVYECGYNDQTRISVYVYPLQKVCRNNLIEKINVSTTLFSPSTEGGKLHSTSFGLISGWNLLCIHEMFDEMCFPAFFRVSGIISSILSMRFLGGG